MVDTLDIACVLYSSNVFCTLRCVCPHLDVRLQSVYVSIMFINPLYGCVCASFVVSLFPHHRCVYIRHYTQGCMHVFNKVVYYIFTL